LSVEKDSAPPRPVGEDVHSQELPRLPAEAMLHPDVKVFAEVTGGRIPGLSQYRAVIETVRLLRAREKLEDAALQVYLAPYWLAWSSRKRLDGSIPPPGGSKAVDGGRLAAPSPEEVRRMLAENEEKLKGVVPMPEELRAKMRGLAGKLAGKDTHRVDTGAV